MALGIENVFAITGDYPKGAPLGSVGVSLAIRCSWWKPSLNCAQQGKWPFYISAAVSPFKYLEEDCAYQYLKLEKKIAAGADFAITQLGFDSRKIRELKRYLDERGLKTPVFGNVYVLPPKAAERMSKGRASRMLGVAGTAGQDSGRSQGSTDKGLAARLERAAQDGRHRPWPGLRGRLHRRHA